MVARVIPLNDWRAAQDPRATMPEAGNVAIAFDVALDRSDAAIAAAWRDSEGVAHVEIADVRPGVGWVPGRMGEVLQRWTPRAVAYDAAGPALDVADVMARGGVTLDGLKAREYAGACVAFLEAVTAGGVRVRPNTGLDAAVAAAARRPVGDAWAWGRRQSATSIAPLTAATVALWAYDHAAEPVGPFRVY